MTFVWSAFSFPAFVKSVFSYLQNKYEIELRFGNRALSLIELQFEACLQHAKTVEGEPEFFGFVSMNRKTGNSNFVKGSKQCSVHSWKAFVLLQFVQLAVL